MPEERPGGAMEFREWFDLDPGLVYLNSGSVAIAPRLVTDAKVAHYREYERNPAHSLWNTWPKLWEVQGLLAEFLGASRENLFMRPNVTQAMSAFLLGIDSLGAGEILVSDHEYGAIVNTCRYRAERDGLSVRTFAWAGAPGTSGKSLGRPLGSFNADDLVERVVSELRPETRLLLLSHVLTTQGTVLPIARIARETRKRGVILAVDGAHATGAFTMGLESPELEHLDFYGGNLHKWAMGPKGTGYGWVHPRLQDRIHSIDGGWTVFDSPPPFDVFGGGSRFQGRLLMSSSQDFSSFFAIRELSEFWKTIGAESIYARRAQLRLYARACAMELLPAWEFCSPSAGAQEGPLLTWRLPEHLQHRGRSLMADLIERHRIQVMINRIGESWCLRIAPALHNREEEIERAFRVIASY